MLMEVHQLIYSWLLLSGIEFLESKYSSLDAEFYDGQAPKLKTIWS